MIVSLTACMMFCFPPKPLPVPPIKKNPIHKNTFEWKRDEK